MLIKCISKKIYIFFISFTNNFSCFVVIIFLKILMISLMYMLFYQMSRMCREKGAVKHDDRLDCLAQGVKYFTDALSISAHEAVKERKAQEWQSMLQDYLMKKVKNSLIKKLILGH